MDKKYVYLAILVLVLVYYFYWYRQPATEQSLVPEIIIGEDVEPPTEIGDNDLEVQDYAAINDIIMVDNGD